MIRRAFAVCAFLLVSTAAHADLVSTARSYAGTNPTGWSSLWCGRFMAMIAPEAARRVKNPNMAKSWAGLPHVVPQVGAIAVLTRKGGGHVGVVTGFKGNKVRVVSGNHGKVVGEGLYPRSRVIAYVSPYVHVAQARERAP